MGYLTTGLTFALGWLRMMARINLKNVLLH